jgi:hypothetical protein
MRYPHLFLRTLPLFLSATLSLADAPSVDEQRSGWQYRRSVKFPSAETGADRGFAALGVLPEVAGRAQPGLADLRLVNAEGREVPYVVDRAVEKGVARVWAGRLIDTRREAKRRTVWTLDLGEPATFDAIALEVPEENFAKRFKAEISTDKETWLPVRQDAGIFDQPWGPFRVHHTRIELSEGVVARYLRLSADDGGRSRPVELRGASAIAGRRVPGARWSREIALSPAPPPASKGHGVSRYRLELRPAVPFDEITIRVDDPGFCRRTRLYEVREVNGKRREIALGEGTLYRLRLKEEALDGEALTLHVQKPQGGALVLEVDDGDSPPLRNPRAEVSAIAERLLFPALEQELSMYYGNEATRAPVYDLEALRISLGLGSGFALATSGPEVANPRFRSVPPLQFAPASGAPVVVSDWRALRRMPLSGREDLYTFTLRAEDLALLRGDYGDLRIANASDRQVPYILENAAFEERVPLVLEASRRQGTDRSGRTLSRYRLSAKDSLSGKPLLLRLRGLELQFSEPFFSRPARVLAPSPRGSRERDRVLFSGILARAALQGAALVVPLDGLPVQELTLEIDEGDNAPLGRPQARGIVDVPRVVFKGTAGTYRVLLGNPQAGTPRYDIASLGQDVLAYSALVTQAGPLEANPSYRRHATDYFAETPPTVLLWVTLLLAIVALLALTLRILQRPGGPVA